MNKSEFRKINERSWTIRQSEKDKGKKPEIQETVEMFVKGGGKITQCEPLVLDNRNVKPLGLELNRYGR